MPTPQEEFQNAVLRILETVMFENWIRFYFLTEKLDAPVEEGAEKPLFVAIPEQGMQRIKELYPDLLPLAESLNGKEISFALSQQAVCSFVMERSTTSFLSAKELKADKENNSSNNNAYTIFVVSINCNSNIIFLGQIFNP